MVKRVRFCNRGEGKKRSAFSDIWFVAAIPISQQVGVGSQDAVVGNIFAIALPWLINTKLCQSTSLNQC